MTIQKSWLEAARAQLKTDNPLDILKKKWADFEILPIYDTNSGKSQVLLKSPVDNKPLGAWLNLPCVEGGGVQANQQALDHLQKGGDGIIFRLNEPIDLEKTLSGIMPEHCFLGFELQGTALTWAEKLEAKFQQVPNVNAALFWTSIPDWVKVAMLFKSIPQIRAFGIEVGVGSIENLEAATATFLKAMDELTDNGFMPGQVLPGFTFTLRTSANFFMDVAMVRSIKILFQRIAIGYGVENVPAFVRVCTAGAGIQTYDPHGAMISDSIGALAAVVASADAVTVTTENMNSVLHQHTARSIALLLREESKLDKVADPLAGSYFVEALTDEITGRVWSKISNA